MQYIYLFFFQTLEMVLSTYWSNSCSQTFRKQLPEVQVPPMILDVTWASMLLSSPRCDTFVPSRTAASASPPAKLYLTSENPSSKSVHRTFASTRLIARSPTAPSPDDNCSFLSAFCVNCESPPLRTFALEFAARSLPYARCIGTFAQCSSSLALSLLKLHSTASICNSSLSLGTGNWPICSCKRQVAITCYKVEALIFKR